MKMKMKKKNKPTPGNGKTLSSLNRSAFTDWLAELQSTASNKLTTVEFSNKSVDYLDFCPIFALCFGQVCTFQNLHESRELKFR